MKTLISKIWKKTAPYLLLGVMAFPGCKTYERIPQNQDVLNYSLNQIPALKSSLDSQRKNQTKTLEELGALYLALCSTENLQFFEKYQDVFTRKKIWIPIKEDLKTDMCKGCFKGKTYFPKLAIEYEKKISGREFYEYYSSDSVFAKNWDKMPNFQRVDKATKYLIFVHDSTLSKKMKAKDYERYEDPLGIIGFEGDGKRPTGQWSITALKKEGFKFIKEDKLEKKEIWSEVIKEDELGKNKIENDLTAKISQEKTIFVSNDSIHLFVYDYGALDGDTIDYYLNNKLIEENIGLKKTPFKIKIAHKKGLEDEINFLAKSTGRLGPCTIKVKIKDGKTFTMAAKKGEVMKIKLK